MFWIPITSQAHTTYTKQHGEQHEGENILLSANNKEQTAGAYNQNKILWEKRKKSKSKLQLDKKEGEEEPPNSQEPRTQERRKKS